MCVLAKSSGDCDAATVKSIGGLARNGDANEREADKGTLDALAAGREVAREGEDDAWNKDACDQDDGAAGTEREGLAGT